MEGFFLQKERKMPGAHEIGAAIPDPRIVGGKMTDIRGPNMGRWIRGR